MISTKPIQITIDLDALTHNYQLYQAQSNKAFFAVVKDNAYGHGDIQVAKHLESIGIKTLCVSSIDEADYLFKHGLRTDFLIFGPTKPEAILKYHQPQFIYTIPSLDYAYSIPSSFPNVRFHIKVNTGMNRLGIRDASQLHEILNLKHLNIEGIYTHFASADESSNFTDIQLERFNALISSTDYQFKWIHAGNSHGAISHHDKFLNAYRIGIGLYGYVNSDIFPTFSKQLKPALRYDAQIIHIDTLHDGDTVGYNQTFTAPTDMTYGVLCIGYADGLNPLNKNLPLKQGDRDVPILGKLCMDQTMIQLTPEDKLGDWIEIIGPHRNAQVIADAVGTIPYVVLTQLSTRIPRRYEK